MTPSGAVAYFAQQTAPVGWLKANGAAVSRTVYADLFAAIGTTYGAGNGSATFNLPDLRGEFLRGWDDGRGVDAGRVMGSGQGDAIRNMTGHVHTGWSNILGSGCFYSDGLQGVRPMNITADGVPPNLRENVIFDASHVVPTAPENRPRNVALLACIKY